MAERINPARRLSNIIEKVIDVGDSWLDSQEPYWSLPAVWFVVLDTPGVMEENEEEKFYDVISEMLVLTHARRQFGKAT